MNDPYGLHSSAKALAPAQLMETPEQFDDFYGLVINTRTGVVHDNQCASGMLSSHLAVWEDNLRRTKGFCQACLDGKNPIRKRTAPAPRWKCYLCAYVKDARSWSDEAEYASHLIDMHKYGTGLARSSAKRHREDAERKARSNGAHVPFKQKTKKEYVPVKRRTFEPVAVSVLVREPNESEVWS